MSFQQNVLKTFGGGEAWEGAETDKTSKLPIHCFISRILTTVRARAEPGEGNSMQVSHMSSNNLIAGDVTTVSSDAHQQVPGLISKSSALNLDELLWNRDILNSWTSARTNTEPKHKGLWSTGKIYLRI